METNTDWVKWTIGVGNKNAVNFGVRQGGDKYNLYAGFSRITTKATSSETATTAPADAST